MLARKWIARLFAHSNRPRKSARDSVSHRFRPWAESLEAREVPATYVWVGTTTDWQDENNWRVGGAAPGQDPTTNDSIEITLTATAPSTCGRGAAWPGAWT